MTKIKKGITLFLTALLMMNTGIMAETMETTGEEIAPEQAGVEPGTKIDPSTPGTSRIKGVEHEAKIVPARLKSLVDGYKQGTGRGKHSKVHWYIIYHLDHMNDSTFWAANQKLMEATIVTGSVRIACVEQGSAHVVRYYDQDTLSAWGKEVGLPFNDPAAPYHDVTSDFRSLSQDVPFYYTNMASGIVVQCLLRRDDKGNPFAMYIQRFARLVDTKDVIAIDPQLVLNCFRCFGAFCKIACGAQKGKGRFYYVWAQNSRSEFSELLLTRTFDLLLQEQKRNAVFTEKEQLELQIHPTQNYPNTFRSWAISFMDGYSGTDPTRFIYQGEQARRRR